MAVAVKNTPETAPQRSVNRLAVGSLAGTSYILGSLAILFYGIPTLWAKTVSTWLGSTPFVDTALLALVMVAATLALALLGRRLIGADTPAGVRAGIFLGVAGVLVIGLIACFVGDLSEASLGSENQPLGLAIIGLVAIGFLVAGTVAFFRPGVDAWVVRFEEQGWFTAAAYKRSQGQRVRRGTILAILVLAACGIYSMEAHKALDAGSPHWGYRLPFVYMDQFQGLKSAQQKEAVLAELEEIANLDKQRAAYLVENPPQPVKEYVAKQEAERIKQPLEARGARVSVDRQLLVVLPHVKFTLPLLLAAASLWLAYRVVNYPTFADFLIATEAELNKVSWTTRKRLVQDTIVVLTTVLFLTFFLFVVDVMWFKALSWVQVLQAGESTGERVKSLDAQIERLQQEREAALSANDTETATARSDLIDALTREKQSILSKTGEEDW